ncbi:MAG TPA: hypothetical protein VM163_14110 [bacterium]|nr:hypothetical protein [bacterium]
MMQVRHIVIAIAVGLTALAFVLGLITDDTPTYAEIEHSWIEDRYLDDNQREFGILGAAATCEAMREIQPD